MSSKPIDNSTFPRYTWQKIRQPPEMKQANVYRKEDNYDKKYFIFKQQLNIFKQRSGYPFYDLRGILYSNAFLMYFGLL